MSDLSLVRTITSDKLMYAIARSVGNAEVTEFKFPYAPIYPGTAKIRLNGILKTLTSDYTIDEEMGIIYFVVAPGSNIVVAITASVTMLTDADILGLLDQYSDSPDVAVKRAAADAMDIIASSEAMISKKIKILDLQTDGASIADSLRKHAQSLRDEVLNKDNQEPCFDIAEQINDGPGYCEKLIKDTMRES